MQSISWALNARGTWMLSVRKYCKRVQTQWSWLSVCFSPLTHKLYSHTPVILVTLLYTHIHKRAHFHPQVWGRLPQRPQSRVTKRLFHPFPQQHTRVAMPTRLAVLVIFGSVASEESQWCCDIIAVSWQLWDRAAEQGRPVNHGICLNVSSERPLSLTSDTLMALTSTDLRPTCSSVYSVSMPPSQSLFLCSCVPLVHSVSPLFVCILLSQQLSLSYQRCDLKVHMVCKG